MVTAMLKKQKMKNANVTNPAQTTPLEQRKNDVSKKVKSLKRRLAKWEMQVGVKPYASYLNSITKA